MHIHYFSGIYVLEDTLDLSKDGEVLTSDSQVLFTLYCTFVLKGVEYGTGQHLVNIPMQHIPIALKVRPTHHAPISLFVSNYRI